MRYIIGRCTNDNKLVYFNDIDKCITIHKTPVIIVGVADVEKAIECATRNLKDFRPLGKKA